VQLRQLLALKVELLLAFACSGELDIEPFSQVKELIFNDRNNIGR